MRSALAAAAALTLCAAAAGAQQNSTIPSQDSTTLSVDAIFGRYEFAGAQFPDIHWLADGSAYVTTRSGERGDDIVRVDPATGRSTVLIDAAALARGMGEPARVEDIVLSDDGRKALVFHNSVRVWRRNTRGVYHVVDLVTGAVTPISRRPGLQMFAKFSPDGRQVAFVRGNDLWVTDLATGAERALTHDGSDVIINGTTDWAYEEELDLRDAFRWSPDSKHIVFWRFDQSAIPTYPILDDGTLYPRVLTLRYPKAGEPNSTVKLGVVTVATGATTWLKTGGDTTVHGDYLARAEWVGNDSIVVQRLPRLQNQIHVLMASAATGDTRPVLTERDSAWLEVDDAAPRWVDGGRQFIWASDRSGWRQYYLYRRDGTLVRRITRDSVDVTELAGVDERRGLVYVVEAGPTPMQRQVVAYSWRKRGSGRRITSGQGTHRVSIAPGGAWMVDTRTSAGVPAVMTIAALPTAAHPRTIEDNAALRAKLARLGLRAPEFFHVPMPDGTLLNAYRIVPADFDSTRHYPVLMTVYGGPGSQTVTDDWGGANYLWHQMLAQHGVVVVSVDNRGTGARGSAFLHATYRHLGMLESHDQIDAAKWLARQPWVDGSRIGIWGWSYGGYMAALTAFRGGSVFRAAISVAPVTDWRLYDAIYTERYMRTPQENKAGYDESSAQHWVDGLTARYLLVHGTGDDNVHPQNSIQLADRLEAAGKLFQMVLYPNRTHSISGGNTRVHLFDTLTRFVEEQLVGAGSGGAPAVSAGGAR
ncbi:MAG TPA: S9 family peptidase [Gemmatimonadaceae bacterium]|nr:S9 family peptidase [Gemmatimonadaceae bacterium]